MDEQMIIKVDGVVAMITSRPWDGGSRYGVLFDVRSHGLFFRDIPSISKLFSMLKNKLSLLKRQASRLFSDQNQYERVKLIGQGTFGKVYLVVNKRTKERFAVKEVVQDPKYKNRELSIISQLDHPNIVEMKDYFLKMVDGQSTLFILMEHMETSLQTLLRDCRKLKRIIPQRRRKLFAFQLMKALAYLELNNVCHRDLKPPNILINEENFEVKVCDFGSAKIIEQRENNVSYICSRYYRAPELILNSTTYGCQVDMWSAGCILAELMTLEPVFPGDSSLEQLIEIIKILGTPSPQQLLSYSSENAKIDLPRVKGADLKKILRRYNPQELQVELIRAMLTYNTKERIRPFDALQHPYFADLVTYQEAQLLPELFQFDNLRTKKNKAAIITLEQHFEQLRLQKEKDTQNETASTVQAVDSLYS